MSSVDRFVAWVRSDALPFWGTHGFDAAAGRFHERLDAAARPLPVPHRAMVQARQIYVYAHAAQLGWYPGGTELAARAFAALRRDFCEDAGTETSVRFSVDHASGAPHSEIRDAYAHAFVLFAAAYLHRATGDPAVLDFARKVSVYVDRALADGVAGGLLTEAGAVGSEKLQNPQMHLLEAWLALAEANPDGPWLDRARAAVALFRDRMMCEDFLPERFTADWGPHPDPAVAEVWEPGHHFEWVWLLDWYRRLSGEDLAAETAALLRTATQPAATAEGLILDQLGAGRVARASHRLWPHCEAIKAAIVAGRPQLAEDGAAALLGHFLGRPFSGGWTDQIDLTRTPIVDYVPASSLYHLTLAATVAERNA